MMRGNRAQGVLSGVLSTPQTFRVSKLNLYLPFASKIIASDFVYMKSTDFSLTS